VAEYWHYFALTVVTRGQILVHLQVLEAAVIAMPNERWGERPLLIVVPNQGAGEAAVQDQPQLPAS
jgi:fatty-acyl-CoA synthase